MVVATDALFDLMKFVVGVEIDIGFDIFVWCVKRYGFTCNGDAVGETIFAVKRFGLVKVVRTVDKVVHAHEQVVCIVRLFEKARRVLVQLRFEDLAVTFRNGRVRCAASPDGGPQEECVYEFCFVAVVEEGDSLDHVRKGNPSADGNIDSIASAGFCDLADNGERVRGECDLADIIEPLGLLFGADGEVARNFNVFFVSLNLEQRAKGVGRNRFGEHDGKSDLVGHFGSAQCGFWFLIARNDNRFFIVIVNSDLKIALDLFIAW